MRYCVFFVCFWLMVSPVRAQLSDSIYQSNIATVKLFRGNDQLAMPLISLNTSEHLQLHFDDLDGDFKNYYYTWQLCDFNWNPVNLNPLDYLKGFTQVRIDNRRSSSLAYQRYTHYQAVIPDRNSLPYRSGNYILKVYTNGDPGQVAFTRRVLVVDNKAAIGAQVVQPLSPEYFRTHQKVQFQVDVKGLNDFSAAQNLKVVLLQNYQWDRAQRPAKPTFVRGTVAEYNSENTGIFPGGKEWRWLDVRDFKLQSEKVATADYRNNGTDIFLKPEVSWLDQPYVFFNDLNGRYLSEAIRGVNPFYEGDYATVHFSCVPGGPVTATDELYIYGELTDYSFSPENRLAFNAQTNRFEGTLFLKQGYYDYKYLLADAQNPGNYVSVDGNDYETENLYTILVYYKPYTSRNDELVGALTIKSRPAVR